MNSARNLAIATTILTITLVITATSTIDWDLSHQWVTPGSVFGQFFNWFGELPAVIALYAAFLILLGSRNRQGLWPAILSHTLAWPLLGLAAWAMFYIPLHYIHEFKQTGMPEEVFGRTLFLAGFVLVLTMLLAHRVPTEVFGKYRRIAVFIIVFVVLEFVLVNLAKMAWGRPRMRSIDSIEQFHYWYQLAGPAANEEFKSFPSGHTANGFVMLALTLFVPPEKKELFKWVTAFAITWGICVALSRVIVGAHFLSDVVVGGYISLLLFYSQSGLLMKQS